MLEMTNRSIVHGKKVPVSAMLIELLNKQINLLDRTK